ncbi:dTDP-4-dehydrorhamnose reductase [Nitratireductor sp. ZSWI3]|uniref:dTDP-4-dehydrorhamnose reductase n=1 Tax=Nitratireductor sp. ZSWI3 TaxID=2966359 RepID=UPI002150265B|nr:dTDP-4-dehydrorhamnose reductase [Nitratireductor sp. ZSWI3]MCR4265120.1 dTDP-4-dehydrorhamnose reductase [Nitratireductor sp. ZSWI3]
MRIVVTGRQGQVALSLAERAALHPGIEIVHLGRPEFDLSRPRTIAPAIAAARPDIVVSAAAYTAVDQAEDEPEAAFAVNAEGAGAVAAAANEAGAPVIHLSTDYVFDGSLDRPYREDDPTGPQGVYGASKLAGEGEVAAANPRHLILRTAWVYSPFGRNFAKTMLKLAETRDRLAVVGDQWGNPTSALDIADAILLMVGTLNEDAPIAGIYNVVGEGSATWADFARHVLSVSRAHGGPYAEVFDIPTSDFPTKARRPSNSRLSTERLARIFHHRLPDWRESVEATISRLISSPQT